LPFDPKKFDTLYDKVVDYLSNKEIFVRDAFVCADENYKLSIRVVNEYPWSNMFAYNMFIRPKEKELFDFIPEWTVVNAPGFMANPSLDGIRQHNFAVLNFERKIALIGGTGYTEK
jgi:phosphoenolpyruvate carboxykinase (ATP)